MPKTDSEITQMLAYVQNRFAGFGVRLPALDSTLAGSNDQNEDVGRAVSLIQAFGNSVFISESTLQADRLADQTLIRLNVDGVNRQAVVLDMKRLVEADKENAGDNFQSIIESLQKAEGHACLIIFNLERIVGNQPLEGMFIPFLKKKPVPMIGVTDLKGFSQLESRTDIAGSLQFILYGHEGKRSKRDKSVLIIGASSFFGHALYSLFIREYKAVRGTGFNKAGHFGFDKLDVTSEDEVRDYFFQHPGFDIVAYVAGEADADLSETNHDRARLLNTEAVERLSRWAKGCKFVYTSSEYVFDGSSGPYASGSAARPINYYGQTKLEGEQIALKSFANALIVRLGALYGYNGPNDKKTTVSKLIAGLDKTVPLEADNLQIKHPILLEDACRSLLKLLDYGLTGIYQLNGPEGLNKKEMAEQIIAVRHEITGRVFSYPVIGIPQPGIAEKPLNTHMVNVDTPRLFKDGVRFLMQKQAAFKGN